MATPIRAVFAKASESNEEGGVRCHSRLIDQVGHEFGRGGGRRAAASKSRVRRSREDLADTTAVRCDQGTHLRRLDKRSVRKNLHREGRALTAAVLRTTNMLRFVTLSAPCTDSWTARLGYIVTS